MNGTDLHRMNSLYSCVLISLPFPPCFAFQELAVNLERLLQLQADYDGLSSTASQNADTPSSSTLLAILENKEKTISSLESRVDVLQVCLANLLLYNFFLSH